MKTICSVLQFAFLFSLLCVSPVYSQSQPADAHLSGNVTDSSGSGVGGVRVTAQSDNTQNAPVWSATSTAFGAYDLSVPPGRYRIHFSRESFTPREAVVDLASGETRTLNFHMDLAPLSSSVLVTGHAEPIHEEQSPAPSSILAREEIDERQAVTLTDLLQFTPGVAFGRTGPFGGTSSLFLNGGNSGFTKVLVDGTPINPPGSAVDLSSVTTENIDKVEIVRGAESAMYGTDAVSGVVQLFTHRGETRIPAFHVFSEGGSFSFAGGGADLSGLLGKFDYSAAVAYFQTDGQGANDGFLNRTASGSFGYSFSDTNQLRFSFRNNASDAGIPGQTIFTPPSLYQGYDQHLFSANARWDVSTGSHWRHRISGTESYTRQHSFNTNQSYYATDPLAFCPQTNPAAVPTAEFCDFPYDSLLNFNRAGFEAQSTYSARTFSTTAGYQYEVENGGVSYISPGHLRRNNQGGYLDFRYSPMSRVSLDFGVRAEANDSFGTRVVPRIGGSLALRYGQGLWGDTRYRAFYGEGIKEPRFDQTFGADPCNPGNPALKPEASKGWSTGFEQKLASDRWKLSADYFYNRFYNIVSFAYDPPPNPSFCGTYINTDLAIARGVNFASEIRLRKWIFVKGNFTYDDTRVLQSENPFFDPELVPGNHLLRRPVNSGSFGVNLFYARVNWNFIGYFSGVRTDSNFVNPTQISNPGYARFDIAASYKLPRGLLLTARSTNLFNKQYQDAIGYPALGRDYRFGLRYQFSGRN